MEWIGMAWAAMASASLTLGLIHLLAWQKHRTGYAHLLFFAVAASATVFGVFEIKEATINFFIGNLWAIINS